jgi:hypothetical protein
MKAIQYQIKAERNWNKTETPVSGFGSQRFFGRETHCSLTGFVSPFHGSPFQLCTSSGWCQAIEQPQDERTMKTLEWFLAKSSKLLTRTSSEFSSQLCKSANAAKARYAQITSSWAVRWNARIQKQLYRWTMHLTGNSNVCFARICPSLLRRGADFRTKPMASGVQWRRRATVIQEKAHKQRQKQKKAGGGEVSERRLWPSGQSILPFKGFDSGSHCRACHCGDHPTNLGGSHPGSRRIIFWFMESYR